MTAEQDKTVRELDRRLSDRGHTLAAFMPAGLGLPGVAFVFKRGDLPGYGGGYYGGGDALITGGAGNSFAAALVWLDHRCWHRGSYVTGHAPEPYWP